MNKKVSKIELKQQKTWKDNVEEFSAIPEEVIQKILNKSPYSCNRIMHSRRAGHMAYWLVTLDHNEKAFLKIATGPRAKKMISDEVHFYNHVKDKIYLPHYYGGIVTNEYSAVLIQDLSDCEWAPPWNPEKIDNVKTALEEVRFIQEPLVSRSIFEFKDLFNGWQKIKSDPAHFLGTQIRPHSWLERKIESLINFSIEGFHKSDDLIHFDVRSDNICFTDNKAILIDWAWYCRGPFDLQMATWVLSLANECSNISPEEFLPDMHPKYIALIAGYFAQFAGTPCPDANHVRSLQYRQLGVALDWLDKVY